MLQLLLLLLFSKSSAGLSCQRCCSRETGTELCKIDPPVCTIPEPKCVHAVECTSIEPGTEPECTSTGEPEVCTSPEPVCTSPEPVCTITKPEGCTECPKSPPMDCASGHLTKDVCGCCDVCAKAEGEKCGGMWGMSGTCAPGLNCETAKPIPNTKPYFNPNEDGVCVKDSTAQDTSCCDPGPNPVLDYYRMPLAEGPNSKFNYKLGEWKLTGNLDETKLSCGVVNGAERNVGATWYQYQLTSSTLPDDCNTCNCLENGIVSCTKMLCANIPGAQSCGLVTGEERYVGDTWSDDCNTCNCQETGIVICTLMFCGNIPVLPVPNGRCGIEFPADNGNPGQCDPSANANEKGPCCSPLGWCGNSAAHCDCPTCVNYSAAATTAAETAATTPAAATNTAAATTTPTFAQGPCTECVVSGIPNKQATGAIGATLWIDRDYSIVKMPEQLIGSTLIQTPHRHEKSTIEIFSPKKASIYIALRPGQEGDMLTVLPDLGWKLEDGWSVDWQDSSQKIWSIDIEAEKTIKFANTATYSLIIFIVAGVN